MLYFFECCCFVIYPSRKNKMNHHHQHYDFRLKNESSLLICGPTQCGKSTLLNQMLADENLFHHKFKKIYWYYGQVTDDLCTNDNNYILREGLPETFADIEPYSCVVLDDLMEEASNHAGVTGLFTKLVHHKKLFVVMLTQNFFHKASGGQTRTRRLNTSYIIIFKNPSDATQIATIGRQMYPHDSKFLPAAFKAATSRPHGYIFIDLKQETLEEHRIRTGILENDGLDMIIYASKKV